MSFVTLRHLSFVASNVQVEHFLLMSFVTLRPCVAFILTPCCLLFFVFCGGRGREKCCIYFGAMVSFVFLRERERG